jgi:prepilin-type N-terminal cleavage/methylation domain-containing protein
MKRNQRGVTLLELMMVIGLLAIATLLAFYDKQADFEQAQARSVGGLLYQYNNAVRASLAQDSAIAVGTRTGSAWLKNTTCGGTLPVNKEFLPCTFPDANAANPIKYGALNLTTVITATGAAPARKITATTTTSPFTIYRNTTPIQRSDLAGMAAISAAAALGTGYTSGAGGAVPFTATTDSSYKSNALDARITMVARNVSAGDVWLRTDGGNSMHASLKFDNTDPLNRQITGASRVQNIAGQVLYLGTATGIAPVSGAGVVVDANAEIIGNLRVRNTLTVDNSAIVTGNVTATGNIAANQNVSAGQNVIAGQNVSAGANVTAGGNVSAGNAMLAQIYYDSNNTGYYVDPSATSNIVNLQSANINNSGTITSGGRIRTGEYLDLGGVAGEGGGCSPNGLIGRDSSGKILSCTNGVWAASGIQGNYTYMGTFTGSVSLGSGSKAQIVMVRGGQNDTCGYDSFYLMATVSGMQVATSVNNNGEWYKTGTITFGVPANSSYNIYSNPYACSAGTFSVYAFNL